MRIFSTEQVSSECFKIYSDMGLAFFIRADYLHIVKIEEICKDAVFKEIAEDDIIEAGLCFAAERKALDYLARAEQSRFKLSLKLLNKKYEKKHIDAALDFLENSGYLSDYRFAKAWINSRCRRRFEGRQKLLAGLLNYGVSKETADCVLDEFFLETTEYDLCLKAYRKAFKTKREPEKIIKSLLNCGFKYQMIQKVLKAAEND